MKYTESPRNSIGNQKRDRIGSIEGSVKRLQLSREVGSIKSIDRKYSIPQSYSHRNLIRKI